MDIFNKKGYNKQLDDETNDLEFANASKGINYQQN